MNNEKFELLKYMTDIAEKESDRLWTRYNAMLTVTGGLFVILTFTWNSGPLVVLLPSLIGLVVSYAWLWTNRWSDFYAQRWYIDMEAVIKSDEFLSNWIHARTNPRIKRPGKSGWNAWNLIPYSMLIFWLFMISICMLALQNAAFAQLFFRS